MVDDRRAKRESYRHEGERALSDIMMILQAVVDDRRAKRESYRQEGERGLIDIMMEDEDEKDKKWRMRL
ncbi:hypothetical protein ACOSQ2_000077 [Xanthoceras sorbifolium]